MCVAFKDTLNLSDHKGNDEEHTQTSKIFSSKRFRNFESMLLFGISKRLWNFATRWAAQFILSGAETSLCLPCTAEEIVRIRTAGIAVYTARQSFESH